jgi:hypothetical protein
LGNDLRKKFFGSLKRFENVNEFGGGGGEVFGGAIYQWNETMRKLGLWRFDEFLMSLSLKLE